MRWFVVGRAIFVRMMFAAHGFTAVWLLNSVTNDPRFWYAALGLVVLLFEGTITIWIHRGHEWKWFCPSVFIYLWNVVPAIWFLELYQMEKRIRAQANGTASTAGDTTADVVNESTAALKASIAGLEINIKLFRFPRLVQILEQILLLILIIGRWMLPKGKLTHNQLSQLLLVYIGTAADIVEFFDAFKEIQVRYNPLLCKVVLAIWSWSLLQFTMVLTATKARKDHSCVLSRSLDELNDNTCCTPDVYGIIISIIMQDAPFLVLRMLLIFRYGVLSYTNLFFTCKNTLVISLLLYRLVMVQVERRRDFRRRSTEYLDMSDSDSRLKLTLNNIHPERRLAGDVPPTYEKLDNDKVGRQLLQQADDDDAEDSAEKASGIYDETETAVVDYIIMRHISNHDVKSSDDRPPPMASYVAVSLSDGLTTDDDDDGATSASNCRVDNAKSATSSLDDCHSRCNLGVTVTATSSRSDVTEGTMNEC